MATPAAEQVYPVRLSEQMSTLKQPSRPVPNVYRTPFRSFGQCKLATTILADQGDMVYVVTDVPRVVRNKHRRPAQYRGSRPMHASTLTIPMQTSTDYSTTSQKVSMGVVGASSGERVRGSPGGSIGG